LRLSFYLISFHCCSRMPDIIKRRPIKVEGSIFSPTKK